MTGDSLPATFCLVYVKFMLENLHIILVSTLPKKLSRDISAREEFKKEKSRGNILTEKYMIDIIREGWKNDDDRLQRVVIK